jgi:hypothetical protein
MVLPPCERENRTIGCQKTTTSTNGALNPLKKQLATSNQYNLIFVS